MLPPNSKLKVKTMSDKAIKINADMFINAMRKHGTDWSKPWVQTSIDLGEHANISTGHTFSGFNPFILSMAAMAHNWQSPHWLTYNQAKQSNGKYRVRRDELKRQTWILRPLIVNKNEDGEKSTFIAGWRAYGVYNGAQLEAPLLTEKNNTPLPNGVEHNAKADSIVNNTNIHINYGGDRAFYSPSLDSVGMPTVEQFETSNGYYSTLFHELGHATGHKSRLDRKFGVDKKGYAFEELVAECSSAMSMIKLGMINEPRDDHAKYLNNWIAMLQDNPNALQQAFSKAERATAWVMNEKR